MKTVREIYDFFKQFSNTHGKAASLMDLLDTIPDFSIPDEKFKGTSTINMSMGMEYLRICELMCDDLLLLNVKKSGIIKIDAEYLAVNSINSTNPQAFEHELEYGKYDFKYRGFVHTRKHFDYSVLPLVGKNRITSDDDIGTCYYIGNNMFVTAAHCIKGLSNFNILAPGDKPLSLLEVWYADGENLDDYDLAIITVESVPDIIKPFELGDPNILDEVMTMGYPPIPGLNTMLVSETASVAGHVEGMQKASAGQVVAETGSYLSKLDFFVITARVKGGNSGGPVINKEGYVIGTVFQLPFDSQGGSYEGRYDIMGYGICLPSKYTLQLIYHPLKHALIKCDKSYCEQ